MNDMGRKPRETDENLLTRMIRDDRYIADRGGYSAVQAAIIPTNCKEMCIVPVTVRPCNTKALRPIDVLFRTYVSMALPSDTLSFNLDEFMTVVDPYPIHSSVPGPFKYTIFTSNHPKEPVNELLQTFPRASDLEVKGNIVIVKHWRDSGNLVDVEWSECSLIQSLVIGAWRAVMLERAPRVLPPQQPTAIPLYRIAFHYEHPSYSCPGPIF
ncbi:hypothetical protein NMY22_g14246 [Coprinellus aureogranulatus]|nr:hypothetical protein NMY22_g14246 [Coprinellus aureogranulatus]